MNNTLCNKIVFACALALCTVGFLPAQVVSTSDAQQALVMRQGLVASIANNTTTAAAAISQLQALSSPTGMHYASPAADFAYAAIDVGHGLLATGSPANAVIIYKAAETALTALVAQTLDNNARDKAQYLQALAFIQGRYLGEVVQAKSNIDQALALQPGDKSLISVRGILASEHADVFIATASN